MKYLEKKCENCDKNISVRIVEQGKNIGKVYVIDQKRKFCSIECQNDWQRRLTWEDRIGKEAANRIRKEASDRLLENNPTHNKDVAKKVSESLKKYLKDNPDERLGEKNPFFGKNHSDETKKFLSELFKDKEISEEHYQNILKTRRYGEDHHFWNGGTSFAPYSSDFNNQLKRKVKNRDNFTCICGKETQKLAIHHIDYDKLNSDEKNLISLCYNCHSKTNSNRKHWEKFFISLITEKYDNLTGEK
jgi:hypothetical protein